MRPSRRFAFRPWKNRSYGRIDFGSLALMSATPIILPRPYCTSKPTGHLPVLERIRMTVPPVVDLDRPFLPRPLAKIRMPSFLVLYLAIPIAYSLQSAGTAHLSAVVWLLVAVKSSKYWLMRLNAERLQQIKSAVACELQKMRLVQGHFCKSAALNGSRPSAINAHQK